MMGILLTVCRRMKGEMVKGKQVQGSEIDGILKLTIEIVDEP